MSERWIRSQRAAVADAEDALLLVARDGSVRRLDGDTAELARVVLGYLAHVRSDDEIVAHVESLAGPLGDRRAVIGQLVALLAQIGAISKAAGDDGAATSPRPHTGANIVVAVSGAIAATHAPALVSALQRRGHAIEVALTQTAPRFVAIDALAAISGRELHTTVWPRTPHSPVPHVALAQWADLVVVYPASGTTVGRIANGDFSDLVSAIALTTRAPVLIAPSMNVDMLTSPAVQRNLEQLRADGFIVVGGVPSQEVADAPAVRGQLAGVAPAPSEVAALVDALRASGALRRRGGEPNIPGGSRVAVSPSAWDAIYRVGAERAGGERNAGDAPLVPWASADCDADLAAALAEHAPPERARRLLDVGCGLGQVAVHAATHGYHVVATEISEVALHVARDRASGALVTWLRDDICASSLVGPFDVVVDRATLHALPAARVHGWIATQRRLVPPGGTLIVKVHEHGVPGITTGWTAAALVERLVDFDLVADITAQLPGVSGPDPVPSRLAVLRRRS